MTGRPRDRQLPLTMSAKRADAQAAWEAIPLTGRRELIGLFAVLIAKAARQNGQRPQTSMEAANGHTER